MNPFQNIRKWKRVNFPDPDQSIGLRALAELETDRDLQKPVQQLLCDVHEECLNPLPRRAQGEAPEHMNERLIILQLQRLIGAQKRMVSLQTVDSFRTGKMNSLILWLTFITTFQAGVTIWSTFFPKEPATPHTPLAIHHSTANTNSTKTNKGNHP